MKQQVVLTSIFTLAGFHLRLHTESQTLIHHPSQRRLPASASPKLSQIKENKRDVLETKVDRSRVYQLGAQWQVRPTG
ncbi:MAG: hypothetical protein Q9183_004813 [Haloplaca sp. 2 TL-2023]